MNDLTTACDPADEKLDRAVKKANGELVRRTQALTPTEKKEFHALQRKVDRGLKSFVETGAALMEIRDRRFYRETHGTFEDYVKDRFRISRAYASRQINGSQTRTALLPVGNILPTNESQCRALYDFPLEDRPTVWRAVLQALSLEAGDGALTAEKIKETVTALADTSEAQVFSRFRRMRQREGRRRQKDDQNRRRETEQKSVEGRAREEAETRTAERDDVEEATGPTRRALDLADDGECVERREPGVISTREAASGDARQGGEPARNSREVRGDGQGVGEHHADDADDHHPVDAHDEHGSRGNDHPELEPDGEDGVLEDLRMLLAEYTRLWNACFHPQPVKYLVDDSDERADSASWKRVQASFKHLWVARQRASAALTACFEQRSNRRGRQP